ncbi:hypothetical protein [Natrinema sp. 1APR25-10V2]|uniref:hypothetical protein n=1 Tax=Natrinema sp. 1APR25-10V2 TaxID=2951081 RepID=UPI002874BA75|nr:hypothetical protein [Natrinema sp. 1APR25-10V2]MDS0474447.1 hypothetical protein [Natrinema sp. 1APR25-10V2]
MTAKRGDGQILVVSHCPARNSGPDGFVDVVDGFELGARVERAEHRLGVVGDGW